MGIKIIGIGSYVPEKELTNFDLEKIVDTSDEWIKTRTGIQERRIALDTECTSDMAEMAAKKALEMAGISADQLDLIVLATVTPDTRLPSTACHVQRKIGARSAACFDFQAACTGTVYGIEMVTAMMKNSRKYKKALLVGCEKLSSVTDWTDRNTCVLFGDAAGAFVFEKTKESGDTLLASVISANGGIGHEYLMIPGGGCQLPLTKENIDNKLQYIKMEGNKVFKLAVNAMVNSCQEVLDTAHLKSEDIDWFIPHQANMRIINAVGERMKFPIEKVITNLWKYGNTSAASIGLALDEAVRSSKIKKGDKLLLTAFGGGMTWGSSILRW